MTKLFCGITKPVTEEGQHGLNKEASLPQRELWQTNETATV